MRFTRTRTGTKHEVELTPMIDIIFLLIIFFMVTARISEDTKADLDLPREQGEQRPVDEQAGLIINIDAEGRIILRSSGGVISIEALEAVIDEHVSAASDVTTLKVQLRADRRADTSVLNEVVSLLKRKGIGAARLATEVPG